MHTVSLVRRYNLDFESKQVYVNEYGNEYLDLILSGKTAQILCKEIQTKMNIYELK